MVKPMFIQRIQPANAMVKSFTTAILKEKICSDQTLHKLKVMLEGTVETVWHNALNMDFIK